MKVHRKVAKDKLLGSTKTQYASLIDESNVTDEESSIAFEKLIKKETYVSLSFKYNCSPEHIRDIMRIVYDKVYLVVKGKLM